MQWPEEAHQSWGRQQVCPRSTGTTPQSG